MMTVEDNLKERLLKIKENNWEIPPTEEPYELALEMMENIGSTDPQLRDSLILGLLMRIIDQRKISYQQMRELLELSLGESHLFYGIGASYDDSVFKRTFTLCIIEAIIRANNQSDGFLKEDEVKHVYKEILRYSRTENDVRGYVEVKGWAHSSAHTADVLCSLAEANDLKHHELMEILQLIKEKICIDTYTYINEEDERLINAVVCILKRKIISTEELLQWINSFQEIPPRGKYPQDEHLRENRKVFLRSLLFRFTKLGYDQAVIEAIQEGLSKLPAFF